MGTGEGVGKQEKKKTVGEEVVFWRPCNHSRL